MPTARTWLRLIPLVGIIFPLCGLAAQSDEAQRAPSPSGDIVVTGRPEAAPADISRQAKSIARPSGNPHRNPLARFEKPVCPGVMGAPQEMAEHIVGRIRYVAQEARIDLAPELTCQVNLLVVFVPDRAAGLRQVERAWPAMFDGFTPLEKQEMAEHRGSVQVITLKTERTRDGTVIPTSRNSSSPPWVSVPLAFSKIYLTTREDIEGVIAMVETRAVDGLSVVQLADYLALRSLAETREPAEELLAMDTILTLFQPDAAKPQSLTDFDRAFLRSLYDGLPNMPAITKTLGLNRQMRKMQAEQEKGGR